MAELWQCNTWNSNLEKKYWSLVPALPSQEGIYTDPPRPSSYVFIERKLSILLWSIQNESCSPILSLGYVLSMFLNLGHFSTLRYKNRSCKNRYLLKLLWRPHTMEENCEQQLDQQRSSWCHLLTHSRKDSNIKWVMLTIACEPAHLAKIGENIFSIFPNFCPNEPAHRLC